MANVNVTKSIHASSSEAWENLSSFRGIENISPIAKSIVEGTGEGATRSCFMPDGAEIKEVLSKVNNDNMHMEYKILSGPFPVSDYVSNIIVKPINGSQSEISWSCSFNSDNSVEEDMKNLFEGFYNTIIDGLEDLLKK